MMKKEYEAEKQRLRNAIQSARNDLNYYVGHTLSATTDKYINEDFTLSVRCLLALRNFMLDRIGLEEAWEEHKLISGDQEEEADA